MSTSNYKSCFFLGSLFTLTLLLRSACAFSFGSSRAFLGDSNAKPKLILIGGCPGTGKSTFGMSVALDQGILKCISTDTVRAVMRSFVAPEVSPALHRSSYAAAFEGDDPVRSWKESCKVLEASVESLVDDAIQRNVSLVVEGVHLIPTTHLMQKWEENGGVALGCLLQVQDSETHKRLLQRRGFITGNVDAENKKIKSYDRIRLIQDEMMKLAKESGWLRIEQRTEPDPLDMVSAKLFGAPLDVAPSQTNVFHVANKPKKHKKNHSKGNHSKEDHSKEQNRVSEPLS